MGRSSIQLKRKNNPIAVVFKAEALTKYIFLITNNDNVFPKRYRYDLVQKLHNTSLELETAIIESKSVTTTPCPNISPNVSAYSCENSFNSPIGEYFLRITSPSLAVNISKGSPSLILRVFLISLGITTLPRSSILLTIPVALIY